MQFELSNMAPTVGRCKQIARNISGNENDKCLMFLTVFGKSLYILSFIFKYKGKKYQKVLNW